MHPGPFTLAELARMEEARATEAWDHTSHLMWMLHEVNAAKKGGRKPTDFHPFRRGQNPKPTIRETAPISVLKMFLPK